MPPAYFLLVPPNFLHLRSRPVAFVAYAAVVCVQAATLHLQHSVGPNFFVPPRFRPYKYDYHRRAYPRGRESGNGPAAEGQRAPEERGGDQVCPGGSCEGASGGATKREKGEAGAAWVFGGPARVWRGLKGWWGGRGGGEEGRGVDEEGDVETGHGAVDCVICMFPVPLEPPSGRMVTPCDHFFHEECLRRWMSVKLECPTCRRALPPP